HRAPEIFADLACRAFRGFQRDVAGKSFRHHYVGDALADAVAFDEADIVEMRKLRFAQDASGVTDLLETLDLLDPDIEQPDHRSVEIEHDACHGAAHDGKI